MLVLMDRGILRWRVKAGRLEDHCLAMLDFLRMGQGMTRDLVFRMSMALMRIWISAQGVMKWSSCPAATSGSSS